MADTNKKILIVEDSKNYQIILSQAFSDAGFNVSNAENGEEGLASIQKEKPDLVLLDIEMPKMDGITMSKKLKESNIQVPVIFLTNMSDLKHISEAVETGADYIIKSDLSVSGIVDRVKERLGLK
jgi:two-component system OmpR family response regulator